MPVTFTDLQGGFELGPWSVIPERGLLRQGTVKEHLEPMVMDVLMVLASHQGSVVTRDQLVNAVWDGRFVADEAIVAKIATLRHKLGDHAKNPTYIETVPRRGYRLMMPVQLPEAREAEDHKPGLRVSRPILIAGLVVLAIAIYFWRPSSPRPIESVAVLQFKCLSGEREKYQYICDGFREELVISLSQVPKLEFTRGPEMTDERTAEKIARVQNVDAVVAGSLRKDGDKIRVTVELILANGFQDWTDRFDGAADNVFDLQEIVATAVRNAILGETGEQIRAASRPANHEAFDKYMRGLFFLGERDVESLRRARVLFEETIKIDPRFGPAYWRLAITHLLLSDYSTDRRREIFDEAIEVAKRGLEADPSIREAAEVVYGFVHHQYGNWTEAAAAYDAAFRGKTIYPTAYQWHSRLLSALGLLDESLRQAITARAMEPASQVLTSRVANAYFWINDMTNARHFFKEANEMGVGAPIHHYGYTMLMIRENRLEEAKASAKVAAKLLRADDSWVDPIFNALAHPDDQEILDIAYETVEKMVANNAAPYVPMIIWALFKQADRAMDVAMQLAESGKLYEHESAQVEIIYLDELKLLREHDDFPTLLQKLGLTDYWTSIGCRWTADQVLCDST